jgi:hypothetical protein
VKRRALVNAALMTLAVVIVILILSPFLLVLVDEAVPISDWATLSSIGQSYTGISAILAAIALIGVLLTFRAQQRQIELQQLQATRELQMQVYRLATEDPLYATAFGLDRADRAAHDKFRLGLYINFLFRYFELGYVTGEISEAEMRHILANENFTVGSAALQWWGEGGLTWRTGLSRSAQRETEFKALVDDEYGKALDRINGSAT